MPGRECSRDLVAGCLAAIEGRRHAKPLSDDELAYSQRKGSCRGPPRPIRFIIRFELMAVRWVRSLRILRNTSHDCLKQTQRGVGSLCKARPSGRRFGHFGLRWLEPNQVVQQHETTCPRSGRTVSLTAREITIKHSGRPGQADDRYCAHSDFMSARNHRSEPPQVCRRIWHYRMAGNQPSFTQCRRSITDQNLLRKRQMLGQHPLIDARLGDHSDILFFRTFAQRSTC